MSDYKPTPDDVQFAEIVRKAQHAAYLAGVQAGGVANAAYQGGRNAARMARVPLQRAAQIGAVVAGTVAVRMLLRVALHKLIDGNCGPAARRRAREILAAYDGPVLEDQQYQLMGHLDEAGHQPVLNADGTLMVAPVDGASAPLQVVDIKKYTNFDRFAARLAMEARMALGYNLTPTTANRLVVQDWLYRRLHKANVRMQHIVQVLPLAIDLAFLKTASEIAREEAFNAKEARERNHASQTVPGERRNRWWVRLLSWVVGSKGGGPAPLTFRQ